MLARYLKTIKTEGQYRLACLQYEVAVHSAGTKNNGAEIEWLEGLISNYELMNNVSPEPIKHSEMLNFFFEKSNMTQANFAKMLDVSQPLINRILNDDVKISRKLASRMSECFGVSEELFQPLSTAALY